MKEKKCSYKQTYRYLVRHLTEQVERIHKIVAAWQPQTAIDKHRIVEID